MLNRLSIRYKIGLIALIGLVGFVIYQTASYRLSISLRDQMQRMIAEDFVILQFTNEIQVNFAEMDKLYESALAEAEMDTLLEADAKAIAIKLRFESLKTRYKLEDPHFTQLVEAFNSYVGKASSLTAAVISNKVDYDSMVSGYREADLLRERYHQIEKRFIEERYRLFERQLNYVEQQESDFVKVGLVLGAGLSILLVLFSIVIIQRLIATFDNAVNVAGEIAKGNLDQKIVTLAEDETGQLINSLVVMRDALKKQKEENIHREKVQGFLAGLNEVMRGDKAMDELARVVLDYLVTELHAQVGVFYLLEGDTLVMLANHAYPESAETRFSFRMGETIVGQAALEQRIKIVNDIPDDYVQVGSAIGRATPRSILLFPVLFEDRLKGVIEIGAFRRFDENDVLMMQRCNDAIAVSLNSAQSRNKVAAMLQQTQEQAEELKKQRQELALFNRQLEEKNFYLDSQRNEILEKNHELERSGRELVEKSRALEQSGKYKSQFLSTMSHELRTPLNSILILSEALMENRDHHLDEREIQHARVINTAGADLLALINDILDLSKVEEGKMEVIIDEIETQGLATGLLQQFEYVARDKGLEYEVRVSDDVPDVFYTDRHRLKQIIKNFISNALKFTDHGGVYLDILRPDELFNRQHPHLANGNVLLFRVRDTGVGIEKSKQSLIFEAFRQADGTTSRRYGGTGLGLSISLALARLLGGDIVLESDGEGRGATFTLAIPMAAPPADASATSATDARVAQPARLRSVSPGSRASVMLHDEIVLLLGDVPLANEVIALARSRHLDARCEADAAVFLRALEAGPPIMALVELDLLGANPVENLRHLSGRIPLLYVVAGEAQKTVIEAAGGKFLPGLPAEAIPSILDDVIQYQQKHSSKVLVIEDNPVFQEVLRSVFTSHHLNVVVAGDGKEALEKLGADIFDCLIVDLNLPDYKGIDLLQRIRTDERYRHQPVIVFTAEDLSSDQQSELRRYASQILLKTPKIIISLYENVIQLIRDYRQRAQGGHTAYRKGDLAGKTLLLVDDDARNIYSMSAMLEAEGINILSARSGSEALSIMWREAAIDMVLLDIMMPEMDGYEVLRRMREESLLQKMPVITVTAKAMVGDREKCMEAGATDYLSKPVEKQALLDCIALHLRGEATT